MKVYKLTNQDKTSYGGLLWGKGVTHEAEPGSGPLCSKYWFHYYEHPLLAVLHNPIHADIADPLLWEAEADGEILREGQMKAGCKRLTTLQVIKTPQVTTIQRVAYGIYAVYPCGSANWRVWADGWLSGKDRTAETAAAEAAAWAAAAETASEVAAAWAAAEAAEAAVGAARAAEAAVGAARAAEAAVGAASGAAWGAVWAARRAARAAEAASAEEAARAASGAARAARAAAARGAAWAAAEAASEQLIVCAEKAMLVR